MLQMYALFTLHSINEHYVLDYIMFVNAYVFLILRYFFGGVCLIQMLLTFYSCVLFYFCLFFFLNDMFLFLFLNLYAHIFLF